MNLCNNPHCPRPQNSENILFCQACGSELLLEGRYRVTRQLGAGGFAKTFEVNHGNTLKVLKVLMLDDAKAVSLFQQEAQVLSHLNHPGIPKGDGYFAFSPKNSQAPLYCLVMEKIEGLDLHQYMEQRGNRPIDEKLALLWLTQLTNILHEVHQQNFFHRDIKPPNIMLKADGHLALIDFGTAREVTSTYHQKAAGQNITGIISPGYTPLEQANGKAVPQSDFFALGRTFVYLLTGKSPDQFSEDPRTGKLMWRDSALQTSKQVAGLIDYLMEAFPGKRPQNAQMILRCLSEINSTVQSYFLYSSGSQLPPTEIEKPRQSRQVKTSAATQIQSSKTKTNIFSSKTAQITGGVIGFAILFLIKFGSREIYKPFQSHPSQPVVTSTPTELQASNSEESANNSEQASTDSMSQQPSISEENISSGVPSGWNKFEGGGAELWLPPSWEGGDPSQNLDAMIRKIKSLGSTWEGSAQMLKLNLSAFSILAFDSYKGESSFPTSVIVSYEKIPIKMNLETYLQETLNKFPSDIRVINVKTGSIEGYELGKIITEIPLRGAKQIYYLIKDRSSIRGVIFSTSSNEFEGRLPVFEASVRTFSVK
ncbi:serine/threonine protein kinase [Nostoc sp. 'Lobaria pulmonaria (5183) cyanobiont']|uniref:serine/threonine protein kinase n=1 Tax=Nostoc sp. 'Lobaria pulmonaria (5183) cyanobiont' TaxID=1618022 RepID=UPI000CF32A90|nr:serine/threonine-protein kinase [Nostoc sp. 'Lobaria pulmonaria (5183) cyanobiont']AVH70434.1 serine/threonine protein kinase [Nostoc sp. 'Lobaria pulmonaria (5183) cyanobiont']